MMRGVTIIILLACVMHAHAKKLHTASAKESLDKFVDNLVDKFIDWGLEMSPVYHGDLDNTMLGKPGYLAIKHCTIPPFSLLRSSFTPPSGDSASSWASCWPQLLRQAAPGKHMQVKSYWSSPEVGQGVPPYILKRIQESPWRGGMEPVGDIDSLNVQVIQGEIPSDLKGTLYRNGPGRIRVGENLYGHWFDGDGFVSAMQFHGRSQAPTFTAKFIRTGRYDKQAKVGSTQIAATGAWTKRGSGSRFENLLQFPTNPSNTHIISFAGKLLALCEGGLPMELDPTDLSTKGEFNFFGEVKSAVAAHSRIEPTTGHLIGFGIILGPGPTKLNCFEADREGRIIQQHAHLLPINTFVHDMALTENYMIFFIPPWLVRSIMPFLLGEKAFGKLYEWGDKEPAHVLIVDRKDMSKSQIVEIPTMSLYHVFNGVDTVSADGSTTLRVTVAQLNGQRRVLEEKFWNMYEACFTAKEQCTPVEYVFSRASGGSWHMSSSETITGFKPLELPDMNNDFTGQDARYFYVSALTGENGEGFLDGLQRIDLAKDSVESTGPVRSFGVGRYAGSPVYVHRNSDRPESSVKAKAEEVDGYVMTYVYDVETHSTQLVVLDAADITADPVATLQLPFHLPFSFHGSWVRA